MKVLNQIVLLLSFILCGSLLAQPTPGELDIRLGEEITFDADTIVDHSDTTYLITFNDSALNVLFSTINVISFEQAYPAAALYNHPLAEGLLRVYRLDCGCDEADLKDTLGRAYGEQIDHVEFNYTKTPTYTPDDYSLGNVSAQGLHLDLIKAKQAWDITKGSADIKVAVMENWGFQTNHPDLASNIAYQHGNVNYLPPHLEHGTFVAGCIAATTDNNLGVSSIGYNTNLMLFRSSNFNDMLWAAQNGANIINCSFSSCGSDDDEQDIINMITEEVGTIIVAGASNGNQGCGVTNTQAGLDSCSGCPGGPQIGASHFGTYLNGYAYPASYDNVISVTSVSVSQNGQGNFTKSYNQGDIYHSHNDRVDISSPGFNVATTTINNGYAQPWGTSFATPVVAGVAALILAANPCLQASPVAVEAILKNSSDQGVHSANPSAFNGNSGAGLVDAHAAVQAAQNYTTSIAPVSSNTTWTDRKFFSQDLIVETGNTLTLSAGSEIWFSEGNKLIVEKGAKLVCDGCTLTSRCLWGGIEIEGTYNQSQYYTGTYNTNQGIVEIKNDAVISNAEDGVLVKGGGILKTEDAIFLNNYRGVNMYSYQNFAPGYPNTKLPNQSKFTNTSFTIDSPVNDYGEPDCGIFMVGVTGVQIKGCTFENVTSVGEADRGVGIRALVSGYFVNSICNSTTSPCPTQSLDNNTFTGFEYGIHHLGYGYQNYIPDIRNAEFNCRYGIYASSTDYFKVMDCSFNVINAFTNESTNPDRYGLYLDQCDKYTITRNSFYTNYGFTSQHVAGVIVSAGGPNYNGIIGNHFTGLYHGIEALGNNWQWYNSPGLRFYCNDFSQTKHDVLVYCPPSGYPWPGPCGIGIYQGVYNAGTQQFGPAANRFTHDCGYTPNNKAQSYFVEDWGDSECDVDFLNGSPNLVTYYHHDPSGNVDVVPLINGVDPITNYNTGVSWQGDPETSCLAGVTGYYPLPDGPPFGEPVGLPGESDALAAMAVVRPSIAAARSDYDNLVDDGDTEYYVNEATTVKEADAYALYNELNGFSPFVSKEVMIALIENEDDFSETLLMQLMTNNSHVVQSEDVLEALNSRTTLVNQTELGNIINYAYANVDAMEELEAKIAAMEADYQAAFNSLISIYASDTLPFPESKDSLMARLDDQRDLSYLLSLVEALNENGYSTDATSTLSSIRSRLTLTSSEDAELTEYEDWYDLKTSLPLDSIGLLDTAYLEEVEDLYETTTSNRVWAFTRSLLVGNGFIEYSEPVYFIEDVGPGKRGQNRQSNESNDPNLRFEIYPNPTSDYLVVDYWITNKKRINPTVTISNSFGQVSLPIQLQSGSGQDIVPIDLPSGIYSISLDYGSELRLVKQFVVIK